MVPVPVLCTVFNRYNATFGIGQIWRYKEGDVINGGDLEYLCNGYGVWINKTKHSGLDLMLFNRFRESWRTSPENWHLSRTYNTITVISHTITHGEHLLRVDT